MAGPGDLAADGALEGAGDLGAIGALAGAGDLGAAGALAGGAGDLRTVGALVAVAVAGFEAVGVLGRGDLGRGLRAALAPRAERAGDFAVEMAAGFLDEDLPLVRGVSFASALVPVILGVCRPASPLED